MIKTNIDEVVCKGCGLCIEYCKKNVLKMSDRRNEKGYSLPEATDPESCNHCLMCEINCPDLAIHVSKEKQ